MRTMFYRILDVEGNTTHCTKLVQTRQPIPTHPPNSLQVCSGERIQTPRTLSRTLIMYSLMSLMRYFRSCFLNAQHLLFSSCCDPRSNTIPTGGHGWGPFVVLV